MKTYRELLREAVLQLQERPHVTSDSSADAMLLLEHCAGLSYTDYYLHRDSICPAETEIRFSAEMKQLMQGCPVQYITGVQNFMGLDLRVRPSVLIPRMDTEVLVETILRIEGEKGEMRDPAALDLCTGSGCIAIALASAMPRLHMTATDLSPEALACARENRAIHHLESSVDLLCGDLYEALVDPEGRFDFIVSNPPYIERDEIDALDPQVSVFEPRMALDGGEDGLSFYRRIVRGAPKHLARGGRLYLEIGETQRESVSSLFDPAQWTEPVCVRDLAGLDRVIFSERRA